MKNEELLPQIHSSYSMIVIALQIDYRWQATFDTWLIKEYFFKAETFLNNTNTVGGVNKNTVVSFLSRVPKS